MGSCRVPKSTDASHANNAETFRQQPATDRLGVLKKAKQNNFNTAHDDVSSLGQDTGSEAQTAKAQSEIR